MAKEPGTQGRRARARTEARAQRGAKEAAPQPSPPWLVPVAVTLLIVGLLYLVVFYISGAQLPLPIGDWNLAVGLGIILVGGVFLTNWR